MHVSVFVVVTYSHIRIVSMILCALCIGIERRQSKRRICDDRQFKCVSVANQRAANRSIRMAIVSLVFVRFMMTMCYIFGSIARSLSRRANRCAICFTVSSFHYHSPSFLFLLYHISFGTENQIAVIRTVSLHFTRIRYVCTTVKILEM